MYTEFQATEGLWVSEMADEIAKSAIPFPSELVEDVEKPLKTSYNEISEKAGRPMRVRCNVFATCKTTKIICKAA